MIIYVLKDVSTYCEREMQIALRFIDASSMAIATVTNYEVHILRKSIYSVT